MNIIELTTPNCPEAEPYFKLTEAQLRNRLEPEKGIFIAETPKVINTALDSGIEPLSFLCTKNKIDSAARQVIERCPDTPVYTADAEILESIAGFRLTRGVLCAMHRPKPRTIDEVCGGGLIAVLENITDSSNVGAIFRSAAALGAAGAVLFPACSDPLNRRTVRTSMGTVFQVPWCYLPSNDITPLRERGYTLLALALDEDSVSLGDERLKGLDKAAAVFGTEGDGLTRETISACDYTVKIPMYSGVDSLNVAAAAAVVFWELGK